MVSGNYPGKSSCCAFWLLQTAVTKLSENDLSWDSAKKVRFSKISLFETVKMWCSGGNTTTHYKLWGWKIFCSFVSIKTQHPKKRSLTEKFKWRKKHWETFLGPLANDGSSACGWSMIIFEQLCLRLLRTLYAQRHCHQKCHLQRSELHICVTEVKGSYLTISSVMDSSFF